MPSGQIKRLEQQRTRRENQTDDDKAKRRAANLADKHRSRVADKLRTAIMADSKSQRNRLDAAVCGLLRKFPSLVNRTWEKNHPTFNGMPSLFEDMQGRHPQLPMRDLRSGGRGVCMRILHSQVLPGGNEVKFTSLRDFESSFRTAWPNYKRSPFTLACAFDRSDIVRALVVEFACMLNMNTNREIGLVLVDEHGNERPWIMTGLDLTIEFGCLETFELLLALEHEHPHVTWSIAYRDIEDDERRALCKSHRNNKLASAADPDRAATKLEEITSGADVLGTSACKCNFCSGNK